MTTTFLLVVAGLIFAYVFFIFPTQAFAACVRNSLLDKTRKMLWIIFILVAWPFGSFCYSFFYPSGKFSKAISCSCALSILLGILLTPFVFQRIQKSYADDLTQLEDSFSKETFHSSIVKRSEIVQSIAILSQELSNSDGGVVGGVRRILLVRSLKNALQNSSNSAEPLQDWLIEFHSRNLSIEQQLLNLETQGE